MKITKVVHLGRVRDLFSEWEKVRRFMAAGRIKGFQITIMDDDGGETIFLGGAYKENPRQALSASLKMSAARALTEDEPPQFKTG